LAITYSRTEARSLILGALISVIVAIIVRRDWMWFIANFCVLANGAYIATAWFSDDRYLDTPKTLERGASSIAISIYCLVTIGGGYVGFRRSCISALSNQTSPDVKKSKTLGEPSEGTESPIGLFSDR
jgi:hypothetical protein